MINKFLSFISLYVLLLMSPMSLLAQQEQLFPLGSNPVITNYLKIHPMDASKMAVANDTLDIPFVDDFSSTQVYPDQNLWINNYVYINSTYPRNPISVGVATFEGLDAYGNPYNNTSASVQGSCDTLTSKPLFLLTKPASAGGGQYQPSDSITLSFYFQKKGWGDAPESTDSLVLEFYSPVTNQWSRQWFSKGLISNGQDTVFTLVQLRIINTDFLQDGFKFRFRNFGAKTGSLDHWHIDYVRLYKAYNSFSGQMDTSLVDVAMTQPGRSLMTEYTSVPWDHFISLSPTAQQNLLRDSLSMDYRVNDINPNDVGFNNRIYDYQGSYVAGFGADNGNIFPGRPNNQNLRYTFLLDSVFPNSPSQTVDSTTFTVKNYFSNGNSFGGTKSNDTVTYLQEFYNFYSMDDGSAEAGYDLISAPTGKVAMKFEVFKPDTLRAVRIFFTQYGDSVNNYLFSIKIWSSLSPETVIYSESNKRAVYVDQINGFANYVLDQIVPVNGTIYVGFQHQQNYPNGIHLGFDKNTASNSRMFYNVGSGWVQTAITAGTFMIRPVMGDSLLFVGLPESGKSAFDFYLAPNPASENIHISVSDRNEIAQMQVLSLEGKLIESSTFQSEFNTSSLMQGVYFIRLVKSNGAFAIKKLIIAR